MTAWLTVADALSAHRIGHSTLFFRALFIYRAFMRCFLTTLTLVPLLSMAQTQVPHVFEDGTPARAAEVNANFDKLESEMDLRLPPSNCSTDQIIKWNATAWICADPLGEPGPQGPQGPQGEQGEVGPQGDAQLIRSSLQRVSNSIPYTSNGVTASCPAGTSLISGGCTSSNQGYAYGTPSGQGWFCKFFFPSGSGNIVATAICL